MGYSCVSSSHTSRGSPTTPGHWQENPPGFWNLDSVQLEKSRVVGGCSGGRDRIVVREKRGEGGEGPGRCQ